MRGFGHELARDDGHAAVFIGCREPDAFGHAFVSSRDHDSVRLGLPDGSRGFVGRDVVACVVRGEYAAAPDEVDDVGAEYGVGAFFDGGAFGEGHADGVEYLSSFVADGSLAGVRADVRHLGELERGLDHSKRPDGLQPRGRAEVVEVPEDGHRVAHELINVALVVGGGGRRVVGLGGGRGDACSARDTGHGVSGAQYARGTRAMGARKACCGDA